MTCAGAGAGAGSGAVLGAGAVSGAGAASGAACVAEEQEKLSVHVHAGTSRLTHLPPPPPSRNSSETVPVTRLLFGASGPYRASSSAADRAGPLRGLGSRSTACGASGAAEEQENCQYMYMQVHLPPPPPQ